jgi:hypothetical protein
VTFTDIQNEVIDRLNLTSAQAIARVGRSINERYKWMVSSLGLQTSVRTQVSANSAIGNRSMVFTGIDKIYAVFNPAFVPPAGILNEVSFDQLRNEPLGTDPPENYAIQLISAHTVTIFLDCVPGSVYPLNADGRANTTTLSGLSEPSFAEEFHNILTYFAESVELEKMEKYDLAEKQFNLSESRLAELRLDIAVSAYLDIAQGIRGQGQIVNPIGLV